MFYLNLIYILLIIPPLFIISNLFKSHKKSLIGDLLIYSFFGIIFLGLIRLLFALVETNVVRIEDLTLMICWHIMFYITVGIFLIATRTLVNVLDINNPPPSRPNPILISCIAGMSIVSIFYLAPIIDKLITPLVKDTIIDRSGIMHFVAFIFAAYVSIDLLKIKRKYTSSIGAISLPMLVSLAFLSAIHLWELLTESWRLFMLPNEGGEFVESILWLPVYFFMAFAFWKLNKVLNVEIDIGSHFGKKIKDSVASEIIPEDKVIDFLLTSIASSEVPAELSKRLNEAKYLPAQERIKAYIPLYFSLENLIVMQGNLKQMIRKEISQKFPLDQLDIHLRVVFVSPEKQSLLLFKLTADPFIFLLSKSLGEQTVNTFFQKISRGTALENLAVTNNEVDISKRVGLIDSFTVKQISTSAKNIIQQLYDLMSKDLSKEKADEIINSTFSFIKHTYEYEFIGAYLQTLPQDFFADERLTYLSREELEKLVAERTEEMKIAQEKELAKTKELLRLKDEFVFIASHDLQTPITAINGFVSLIDNSKVNLATDIQDDFAAIKEASGRLKQLVSDLLEIARSDSGTIKIDLKPTDINKIISTEIEQLSPSAIEKQVTIRSNLDQKSGLVLADDKKVIEVIQNLISNAIKYNKTGGTVDATTSTDGSMVSIRVADSGVGIPIDQQKKVFDKFFRAQQAETRNVSGTGLGLFIVRMLVEKMGGSITFTSEEGKGTTFTFQLKLA